jgi:lipopolysaccharide assembly protein B
MFDISLGFPLVWLLLGLPLAFALGWVFSRFDLRQWQKEKLKSPNAFFKGLSLLLNEQQDRAIDAFIEALQQDPRAADLHFALGNLFRRRGEYERAVRVHEHLLRRGDISPADRERAQLGLAQDFMAAGLIDRAEAAWKTLEGTAFDREAQLALLTLHEKSRNWNDAIEVAQKLERGGYGSFAARIGHYWCELALMAQQKEHSTEAQNALTKAREIAPQAPRPMILKGFQLAEAGQHGAAIQLWQTLMSVQPAFFALVAESYAKSAIQAISTVQASEQLQGHYQRTLSVDSLQALELLEPHQQRQRLTAHLQKRPGALSAAKSLLKLIAVTPPPTEPGALTESEWTAVNQALEVIGKPLLRYRCAACGFESKRYFWQCPGCLSWDSYPPQRLEEE